MSPYRESAEMPVTPGPIAPEDPYKARERARRHRLLAAKGIVFALVEGLIALLSASATRGAGAGAFLVAVAVGHAFVIAIVALLWAIATLVDG